MTNAAITIHNNIAQEGIEVDSDEYYNEVDSRLRKYFPENFESTLAMMTSQKKRHRNPSKRLPRLVVVNKDAEL